MFPRWLRRLKDRDLDDELRAHLEIEAQQRIVAGETPEQAAQAARRAFGNVGLIKDETRDVWRHGRVESVIQDLRYAGRAMRKAPGFTVVALLTLSLGIGANTAIFSVVEAIFLRPLPVTDPGRLVLFSPDFFYGGISTNTPPDGVWVEFSSDSYESLRDAGLPFSGIAAFDGHGKWTISLRRLDTSRSPGAASPAAIRGRADLVSGNYFAVMGAQAVLGRRLEATDDQPGAAPVVVVSDRFWRTTLNHDPQAVGKALLVNRLPVTVVGVMPPEFFGERVGPAPDLWVPLVWQPDVALSPSWLHDPHEYWLALIGRLAPGQTRATAESAATAALRRFLTAQAGSSLDAAAQGRILRTRITMASGAGGISDARKNEATSLTLLAGSVGLVLLVACANVATLLLSRAGARRVEAALRRTLGASPGRLVRQWLTESLLLGALGTSGGLLLAHWVLPSLQAQFPNGQVHATLNGTVLLFTAGVALFASLVFGLVPAVQAGQTDPIGVLRSTGRSTRGRHRAFGVSEPFVIAQIAVSLVLVIGATLFARTLFNVEREPLGFDQDNVLLATLNPRLAGYTPEDTQTLYRALYDRIVAIPGVESATFARYSPFSGAYSAFGGADIEGYTPAQGEHVQLEAVEVGPNYPQTLGMPLVAGRAIDLRDVVGAPPVAMVNEAFGHRYFPASTPLGHHLTFDGQTFSIVGVVKDALFHDARDSAVPFVFTPMLQERSEMALNCEVELRTAGDAHTLVAAVRKAVATDSRLTVDRAETMREQVLATLGPERQAAAFVGTFAGLALLLAAVGLYGIISHNVTARTNEIGVRVALGADRADIVWLIVRRTLLWLAIGLGIGTVGAASAGHLVENQLFGVTPADLTSLGLAAVTLTLVGLAASLVPAARALRVHPAAALRTE